MYQFHHQSGLPIRFDNRVRENETGGQIREEIAPELTKRHLQRAYDCLNTFIDAVHQEVSDYLDSEYTGWNEEIADTLRDSDERLDYIEEPDSLREKCDLPRFEEIALCP